MRKLLLLGLYLIISGSGTGCAITEKIRFGGLADPFRPTDPATTNGTGSQPQDAPPMPIRPFSERLTAVPDVESFKSRSGYFKFEPQLVLFSDETEIPKVSEKDLSLCDKIQLQRIVRYDHPDNPGWDYLLEVKQGKKTLYLRSVGTFSVSPSPEYVAQIDEWLSRTQILKNGVLNLKTGKKSRRTALCIERTIFTGMSPDELVLMIGLPERINRTVSRYGEREQWVYGDGRYFYFDDGRLDSWQD